MARKKIKDLVADELMEFLTDNGFELYNVEFIKEAKDWFLRVYIDHLENMEGEIRGISTDDCEMVSRFLSGRLDEMDPIEQNYYLEVSSPGMDRALLKESDFTKYKGKDVEINLYQAIDGNKTLTGKLVGLTDGKISIIDDKEELIEIEFEKAAKTKLAVIF